jgi:hypothetical protein
VIFRLNRESDAAFALRKKNFEGFAKLYNAVDNPTRDDLETHYSYLFGKLIDTINTEWIKLLRELLAGEMTVKDTRQNAKMNHAEFMKRVAGLTDKIDKKKFGPVLKSMANVFSGIDERIKSAIKTEAKKAGQQISEIALKAPSPALKDAVQLNVELIKNIASDHIQMLTDTVSKAVRGAGDFQSIVNDVMKISDKGKSYAVFVAKDQAAKAYADIAEERQKAAGAPGFIWECVNIPPTPAKRKGEVRPTHWHLRNRYFTWDNLPIIDGKRVKPGEEVNCRCKARMAWGPKNELQRLSA